MTLYVYDESEAFAIGEEDYPGYREASPNEILTAVRAGVESGTIEGEEMSVDKGGKVLNRVMLRPGDYLVIPVNGGE